MRDTRPSRRFRHVPLGPWAVWLHYAPRRVNCPNCQGISQRMELKVGGAGKRRYTKALAAELAREARVHCGQALAKRFGCSWSTVQAAVEDAVVWGLEKRDLSQVRRIGVDELSRKKGHVYVTGVYDLNTARLLWAGEGRKRETLRAFFDWLGPQGTAKLEGICCDMWRPYIEEIKQRAPQASLVFNKFHIVNRLSKATDQVRRDEMKELEEERRQHVKGMRTIWPPATSLPVNGFVWASWSDIT